MIMDTISNNIVQQQQSAYALMKRGKRGAASLIAADCSNIATAIAASQKQQDNDNTAAVESILVRCKLLDDMLDILLNPYDAISEWNNLDWLRWLIAGGKTLDEFSNAVKNYDFSTCCGLVWTANYVAYRCRTCSISPCMSLCGDCFKRGNHTGHDFNMFRSQAGGACDCGDPSVMKPNGFCPKHSNSGNIENNSNVIGIVQPPVDLLSVAERIMPRLFLRLVQYLRENSKMVDPRIGNTQLSTDIGINHPPNVLLVELDPFLSMLHDLSGLGAAMRKIMTLSLTNEKIYQWACDYYNNIENVDNNESSTEQTIYTIYTDKVCRYYHEAIHQYTDLLTNRRNYNNKSTDNSIIDSNNSEQDIDDELEKDEFVDGRNSVNRLSHSSFLQEIVFWTVRYEFPQKMVCLLLNLLPDSVYKESLTEAFVMHYGCIGRVLATTRDSDTLSNHIVHISVQLFSNEALATRMVHKLGLLRIMVSNLRRMMTKILIPCTLHDITRNKHKIVDCSQSIMKDHSYWPLVSDLNNVLSHRPIAIKFMCDGQLLKLWFSYLSMFQGMNVNCQELGHHVEFEPNTYYAAFSAELEASAYPMWAMLSHLVTPETLPLTTRVLQACLQRLQKWLIDIGHYNNRKTHSVFVTRTSDDRHQFTFHLPLHRYFAVFLCQAVRCQGACVKNIIQYEEFDTVEKDEFLLAIVTHPIRAQSAFYEIMQGSWIRNGLQIKGQAMTYIQSNFCISMVDADIYLIQLCLSELSDPNIFMSLILEKFNVYNSMRIIKHAGLPQIMSSLEYGASNMESLLMFLATLVGVRTNLCSDKDYEYCQTQLEIVTLLCVSDKTHSQLIELMPERCAVGIQTSSSTNVNGTSQNHQESPLPTRDFENVLQAVAEYKRPQFEESGTMQQGLYVPLPEIWRNLYDPIHVLLRAVHRRDFQSSMDRYTTFMRSIGLLRQNQTPWPPYRTPLSQHPAYKDPRRALLSKLFHTVVWHSLYRSVFHKDVCEHILSVLIYLLDQALICYNNASVTNNNQMNSNPNKEFISGVTYNKSSNLITNICPKRRIKITADIENESDEFQGFTIMDSWYENDDLINNLCTVITHIELPQNYVTLENSTSTIANNIFDYFKSVNSTASNHETVNSHQQQNVNLSLDMEAVNTMPVSHSSQNESESTVSSMADTALNCVKQRLQFLCPPPQKLMSPNIEEQPSTSLQDPPVLNSVDNFDINNLFHSGSQENKLPSHDSNIFMAETKANDKNQQHSLVSINESIISLLLRLHSHLSGNSDSYQPPPLSPDSFGEVNITTESVVEDDNTENVLCGDGSYYIGRLLNCLAKNRLCYECIISTRHALWPKAVIMRETATREDEECERQERKRRARDKQQKLLQEMALAQKNFLEHFSDLDSTNIQLQSPNLSNNMECDYSPTNDTSTVSHISSDTNASLSNLVINIDNSTKSSIEIHQQKSTVDCVICNQTVFIHIDQQYNDPVGLVILVQGTNILAHQRHLKTVHSNNYDTLSNDQIEGDEKFYWPSLQCRSDTISDNYNIMTTYASHSESRKRILCQYFSNLNKADSEIGILTTTAVSNTPIVANVHVQTCGHHLHLRCWDSYISSLRGTQRFNSDRGEYSCPLCRQLANSLMPLIPPSVSCDNQKYPIPTYNTKTDMSYAMNKLTDIIIYQESILVKPMSTNSDNFMGEFSSTPIINGEYLFDNELNFQHRLHNYESASGLNRRIENIESGEDPLLVAINKCVSDMITTIISTAGPSILLTSVERDNLYKIRWHSIISVAWTNIQVELVQRNNNLIEEPWSTLSYYNNYYCQHKSPSVTDGNISSNNYYKMLPKRNCLAPLLKVLRTSARWLVSKYPTYNQNPISDIWYKLIGVEEPYQKNMIHPPLLLRDPCNVLLQLMLLLPILDDDLFDTLVKLTYNMQVYVSALKVATALNHGPTSVTTAEETSTSVNNIDNRIAMDVGDSSSSSMDITECTTEALSPRKQPTPFMKTVAFVNSVVFSTQDKANDLNMMDMIIKDDKFMKMHHDDRGDMVCNDRINISYAALHENNGGNTSGIFLLEEYGRQCTLPFLRFAALLKKYINENDTIDTHYDNVLTTVSLPLHEQSNICVEQQSGQTSHSQHGNKTHLVEEANYSGDSMKNLPIPHCYCHLLRDDREFLMLARYLNLLSGDDSKKCNCRVQDSNYYENVEIKQCNKTLLQPPSIMNAVTWPQSHSVSVDNVDTTISRTWLMSFRESLIAARPITMDSNKIPSEDLCTNVTSSVEVNQNSTTNIMMSARLLLGVDCCDGDIGNNRRFSNGDNNTCTTSGRDLLPTVHWIGPRLLRLPHLYDDLFQYYISRPCFRCHSIPRETSVCLICGTVVCLKENCCRSSSIYEAVQHSLECGGSTGIFLVVTSSSIVVIRGKRACLWGSVYLDAFGEEDRELKRGKPLYLSAERYRLLERQWLAHRFDHTNKKWVWHRDAL